TAAVVIHPQATADIEEFDVEAHFAELGVKTGGFLHCPLDNEDVGHLGTDMKVQQLETVGKVFGLEHFGSDEQFGGAEAELGILSGALGPTARTFALQA